VIDSEGLTVDLPGMRGFGELGYAHTLVMEIAAMISKPDTFKANIAPR
jgi:hypothetical protein